MDVRRSVLKLFSSSFVIAVVEFGAIAVFTQLLGAGAMGSYFVFQAVVGLLGIPIDLGLSKSAEKQLSADEPAGEVITTAVVLKTLLLLPWVVGLLLASARVERYVGIEGVLPLVVLGLVVAQVQRLCFRLLAGSLRVGQTALLKTVDKLVWVGSGLLLVSLGVGPAAIIAGYVLGKGAAILGALFRLDLSYGRPRTGRARSLLAFGRYVFIGDVGGFIYSWMDVAILRLFVPTSLIGAYEIAWRVASISMMLTRAIRTSLFPQISQWYAEDRLDEIETAFRRWIQMPLYLTIPAFAGAVVLGRDVLGTLFGAEVVVAYPVLLVFMLEKILRSVQPVIGPSLFAMGKPELGYRESMAAIVVNLTLNVALIPAFGLMGAAVATTLSAATAATIAITYVNRFVRLSVPWSRILWSAGAAATMAGVVALISPAFPTGVARVVSGVGIGVALYGLLLLANGGIRLELRSAIRELIGAV